MVLLPRTYEWLGGKLSDGFIRIVDREGIDLGRWRATLDASERAMDLFALAKEIAALELVNTALIDCTADASLIDAYPAFIEANLHIVTPNKLANVLPWPRYTALKQLMAARRRHFFDATNVTFATTGGSPGFIQTVHSHDFVGRFGLSYKFF